ncbi:MAG: sigma-54 dependent transcriptional regulator [Desulfobacteraceae bacterium]|nr:sigma-54 dependent transcriptional regulator [Desulfobacteraceae bacterium]
MNESTCEHIDIFIIDDEPITVQRLVQALKKDGYLVRGFVSAKDALDAMSVIKPRAVIVDVRLKDADGVELMRQIKALDPEAAIIIITGYASIDQAVEATKKGAFHYLAKPLHLENLRVVVRDALENAREKTRRGRLDRQLRKSGGYGDIIGASPSMRQIFKTIAQVAGVDCNVFIQGESGTGKELVAKAIHINSLRAEYPFVSFNCGAFSEDLVANELFGHEKEAFTGAVTTKLGLLETANKGTVFLDEVGEMPLSMQVKLLRVLQERVFLRVGGVRHINLDVRFIAATNRDITKMIEGGDFRKDLFYRLKVVMMEIPPLRDRREDIQPLVNHFVEKAVQKFGKDITRITQEFLAPLDVYPFPGNVRELENIIERAVVLNRDGILGANDLPPDIACVSEDACDFRAEGFSLRHLEQDHILSVYQRTGYNQSETARILGISRTTLWRRLRDMKLLDNPNRNV